MKTVHKTAAALALTAFATQAFGQADDAGHRKDYRTFHTDGDVEYGSIEDSYTADLVLYLAGNQFMVM